MQTLHEKIKAGIKEALLAKDQVKLDVYRGISATCTNELVAKGRKPQETLSDEEVLTVITRLAKQRKDSIEQFQAGGRADLVAEETAQLKVLEVFLPTMMSQDDIRSFAQSKQLELSITDPTKKGILMAALMKDLKGKADGTDVKVVVDSLF